MNHFVDVRPTLIVEFIPVKTLSKIIVDYVGSCAWLLAFGDDQCFVFDVLAETWRAPLLVPGARPLRKPVVVGHEVYGFVRCSEWTSGGHDTRMITVDSWNLITNKYTRNAETLVLQGDIWKPERAVVWSSSSHRFVELRSQPATLAETLALFDDEDAWTFLEHMPGENHCNLTIPKQWKRSKAAHCHLGSVVYVCGGSGRSEWESQRLSAKCCTTTLDTKIGWHHVVPMRYARSGHCCVAVPTQNCFFVIGGKGVRNKGFMERHDATNTTWKTIPWSPHATGLDTSRSGVALFQMQP